MKGDPEEEKLGLALLIGSVALVLAWCAMKLYSFFK